MDGKACFIRPTLLAWHAQTFTCLGPWTKYTDYSGPLVMMSKSYMTKQPISCESADFNLKYCDWENYFEDKISTPAIFVYI